MLNFIKIRNYALIESAEVEFSPGFNVFTGESGAGKSILMSAVDLLLGGRSDRGAIRSGSACAEIAGMFTVPAALRRTLLDKLAASDIAFDESDGELYFRRVMTPSATRNYINDTPVSARLLAETGALLMDRHGVGEQLSLLQPSRQLELLDRFGSLGPFRNKCAETAAALTRLEEEISSFEETLPDESEADRLSLVVEDIERVDPVPGEDAELEARHRLAANSREILSTASCLSARLYDEENSIADQLGTVCRQLQDLEKIDEKSLSPLVAHCVEIQDSVSELSRSIQDLAGKIELDPGEFAALEERMAALHTLKRRYAPTIEMLLETLEAARKRLDDFRRSAAQREEFSRRRKALTEELSRHCQALSQERQKAARALVKELLQRLELIGFTGARLEPEFTPSSPSANGSDHFELFFSANKGEELRPLRKIASSGELSRIMLAFKTALADADAVPTVVFDEIDMNIGGETANKVGEALKLLGEKRQILSISHLAQVASCADRHFVVEKFTSGDRTYSQVRQLTDTRSELGRMMGNLKF
ncbi:MAG: DNA repair protein RecN [Lentisphaeria bacterium]|nr:DNA repair protein RecN [Lentisphaeria bacterium]